MLVRGWRAIKIALDSYSPSPRGTGGGQGLGVIPTDGGSFPGHHLTGPGHPDPAAGVRPRVLRVATCASSDGGEWAVLAKKGGALGLQLHAKHA